MLTEIIPGKETQDELQLLNELHATCKQMQLRVLDLIRTVGNEEVTCEFRYGCCSNVKNHKIQLAQLAARSYPPSDEDRCP